MDIEAHLGARAAAFSQTARRVTDAGRHNEAHIQPRGGDKGTHLGCAAPRVPASDEHNWPHLARRVSGSRRRPEKGQHGQ